MSYFDFDLARALTAFGLSVVTSRSVFTAVAPVPVSAGLAGYWANVLPLGLTLVTEKARSEMLVSPLLSEVWHRSDRRVSVLSGVPLAVDAAAGLTGVCDFVLCRSENLYFVTAPVLTVVEAKRDSIPDGLGQCAAEMVAAQRMNGAAGLPPGPVYGCVTTGSNWKFLRLADTTLDIDVDDYPVPSAADKILGIVLHCCGVAV